MQKNKIEVPLQIVNGDAVELEEVLEEDRRGDRGLNQSLIKSGTAKANELERQKPKDTSKGKKKVNEGKIAKPKVSKKKKKARKS